MKSYFLVPIVFIMSLLSSCQELGNPYTDSVSVKSIQVDTCYYSSKNDCIWYGLNVQIDKFVSPYSFVEFVFEIGNKSYYVRSDSSLDGEFYLLLNLPVSEYTFDYVANIASTGRCYVYVSGFEYVGRYEYGEFKYILPSFDAILPKGSTFNSKVNEFIAQNGGITEIAFITNSPIKSDDVLVRDDVYMVKNQNVLEIHTLADSFVVNEDASDMFRSMGGIQAIDFGESFNTQNVTDMNVMFCGCTTLTSLDVSNFNTQNVTDMSYMFGNCSSLTSLDVSNFDTQNVTDMGSMFSTCSNLTLLDVSKFNTQKVTDMSYMFAYVGKLSELNLLNFDFTSKPQTKVMFYYLGSSVVNRPIPIYVTTDGKFYLQGKEDTGINSAYAVLTSVDDSNFEVPGGGEHGDEEWL